MQFARIDAGDGTPAPKPLLGLDSAYWFKIIEAASCALTALLIGLFVARPLINRMFAPSCRRRRRHRWRWPTPRRSPAACRRPPAAGAQPGADGAAPALPAPQRAAIDISRIEGQVRESSIKKVGEVVTRPSRRSAGDHPHLAASTGLNHVAEPPNPPSRKTSAPSPAPNAPPSSCCRWARSIPPRSGR